MRERKKKKKKDVNLLHTGIGGMAAALTLGMRGHHVTILEAAPKVYMPSSSRPDDGKHHANMQRM